MPKITRGMTKREVQKLLGRPSRRRSTKHSETILSLRTGFIRTRQRLSRDDRAEFWHYKRPLPGRPTQVRFIGDQVVFVWGDNDWDENRPTER
ncbi:hypothetical protein [Promicromonospora soli]